MRFVLVTTPSKIKLRMDVHPFGKCGIYKEKHPKTIPSEVVKKSLLEKK